MKDASTMSKRIGLNNLALAETLIDPRKCPKHRAWIRKGICELCQLEKDKALAAYKQERGIVDVPIKVISL